VTGDEWRVASGEWREYKDMETNDRLESYGIYQLARQLFDDFWIDSDIVGRDYRGRELCKQQIRSLDSICANIEEGYGRGFGKDVEQHLKVSRGEARESLGRYQRFHRLLPADIIEKRVATLNHIIGGLTKTIVTMESKRSRGEHSSIAQCGSIEKFRLPLSRHAPLVTRHASQ